MEALRKLLAWWLGELAALLPAGFSGAPSADLEVRLDGARAGFTRLGRSPRPLGEIVLDEADPGTVHRFTRGAKRAAIRLAPRATLRPVVELPAAAAQNLREALAFEMDRHTPFPADEVEFDARIQRRDPAAARITVEMAVARKTDIMAAMKTAARLGLTPVAITGPEDHDLNLLPAADRPRPGRQVPRLMAALGGLALILAATYAALWFGRAENRLAANEARLTELRAAVSNETRSATRAAEAIARAERLPLLKASQPLAVEILDEVSKRLSDDHWTDRIAIERRELRIDAISAAPADLLRALEASPLFANVRFTAAVVRDPGEGRDRVSAAADLVLEPSE